MNSQIIAVSTRCSEQLNSFHIGYNGTIAYDNTHYISALLAASIVYIEKITKSIVYAL